MSSISEHVRRATAEQAAELRRRDSAGGALAQATARMGEIAAHLHGMGEALASEARSFEQVGAQLDKVEARLDALAALAGEWQAQAKRLRRGAHYKSADARVAGALDGCADDLRRAIGGT